MTDESQTLIDVAINAAKAAGSYLMENYGKLKSHQIEEKQRNDFVTTVDKRSEQIIIEIIKASFPEHGIVTEESGLFDTLNDTIWIIDPLDGTTNYIREIPAFSVSIAVKNRKGLLVGVVYNPAYDELFTAENGKGAFLNKQPIQVSTVDKFERAFLATGFPHHSKHLLPYYIPAFTEIFYKSAGIRRIGSAALDLCYTACGRFDGFWEAGLHIWDVAAGSLIVTEAGGIISDFFGDNSFLKSGQIVAGNQSVYKELLEIISYHFKGIKNE